MIAQIFTLWLVTTPFIVWGGAYEGPKVFAFLIGGFLLSLYWIKRSDKKSSRLKFERYDYWYLGWLLVLVVSSAFGVHPGGSLLGTSYRHQGVIFFLALWLVGKTFEILSSREKKFLYKGIGIAVLAEGLIVLTQVIFGKLYLGKPLGTLGEVNAVAGYLATGSYFVFVSFPKIVLIIPAVSIILTQSRSGFLAFASNIGFITNFLDRKKRIMFWLLGALVVSGAIIYFSQAKGSSVFESRPVIWRLAVEQILKRPVLGYGAESGEVVYNKAFNESWFPLSELIVDRAHNIFLDVTMWSGVAGLIFFCGFLFTRFNELENLPKKFAYFSFITYAFLQPLSVVHWILFFLII